jgi:hypothetical protein
METLNYDEGTHEGAEQVIWGGKSNIWWEKQKTGVRGRGSREATSEINVDNGKSRKRHIEESDGLDPTTWTTHFSEFVL